MTCGEIVAALLFLTPKDFSNAMVSVAHKMGVHLCIVLCNIVYSSEYSPAKLLNDNVVAFSPGHQLC